MAEPSLLDRLRASDLLPAQQVQELARLPQARDPDPRLLGRLLLERGLLTLFQVNLVAAGRGHELRVGPYLLLERLGEGGMGQVFKARHQRSGQVVALKVMRKEKLASADAVARFYKEVQAVSQLHHPNIVQARDAGEADHTHYFAMEYVDGPDLARLVREQGPLSVGRACEYARQAALGLQHAHERGMVHRDVKPSNLLLASVDGVETIKILDLGLARLEDSADGGKPLTRLGQVIGTPDYLPPEQALDARTVDARADVYSLGCSLYFLLTGRAPFQAASLADLLCKHQLEQPAPLRPGRPEVPAALDAFLARMMAKKREQRPRSAAAVAAALAPFCPPRQPVSPSRSPQVPARPDGPGDTAVWSDPVARPSSRRGDRRSTLLYLCGIGLGVLLLAGLVAALGLCGRDRPAEIDKVDETPGIRPVNDPKELPPVERPKDERKEPPREPPDFELLPAPRIEAPRAGGLTPAERRVINRAIGRGVAYLKRKQHDSGTWSERYSTGLAALPGLTLLTCGVLAADPRVQKAADLVRPQARTVTGYPPEPTWPIWRNGPAGAGPGAGSISFCCGRSSAWACSTGWAQWTARTGIAGAPNCCCKPRRRTARGSSAALAARTG
jgi:serine/threonine-protein kinase